MRALLQRADDVLRVRPWVTGAAGGRAFWLPVLIICFGMVYGGVMGSFSGRPLHILYAALKVPLLLLATGALSLPCFFVLYTLMGLREEFGQALRALLAAQAGMAVILASLAPLTALWYCSSRDYTLAILFNGAIFAMASLAAQWLVRRYYQPLIARHPRHRILLRAWLLIYIFVGIQMGWILRPFVGAPEAPVQFFRANSWGNAYEVVVRLVWQALSGG